MIQCPYCHFQSEDGSLFCEQCKSDLQAVAVVPVPEPVAPLPVLAALPVAVPAPPPDAGSVGAVLAEEAVGARSAQPDGEATKVDRTALALLVLRGRKIGTEYPLYDGQNFIGRADERPVDIDLEDQEPPDRIWSSRQHAVICKEGADVYIEDLNSSNGTFLNRNRVYPGQRQPLQINDVIQIGTVQLRVVAKRQP